MPVTKGDKNIIIHRQLVQPLQSLYRSDPQSGSISFNKYVNEVLRDYVRKRSFIEEKFPHLSVISIQENVVIIKNAKNREVNFIEVYLKDSKLWCQADESDDCDHVHYVLSLPEAGRLNIKKPAAKNADTN